MRLHTYMRERFETFTLNRPKTRKTIGWVLVVVGFLAIVTPLTPGGFLFFVGLEILGLRLIFTEKVKRVFKRKQMPDLVEKAPQTP